MNHAEHDRTYRAADPSTLAGSDAELMTAVVAGDHSALEALHRRYNALVWRIAARILCDDVEAEDVTQEVFLEIYERAHLYDGARGTVRVWLVQYAYHRAISRKASLRLRATYRACPWAHWESSRRSSLSKLLKRSAHG